MLDRLLVVVCSCLAATSRFGAMLGNCIWQSPLASVVVLSAVSLVLLAVMTCNAILARAVTVPGTIGVNLVCFWLLLRLVVRVLVFPGSIVCYKRNTEASYRVEMSRLYTQHLQQLQDFLVQASERTSRGPPGATMEDVLLGCIVIEGLARNFHVQQQRFQVKFSAEQMEVHGIVQFIKRWISDAEVRERNTAGSTLPLMEWLRRASGSHAPVAAGQMLQAVELQAEAAPCIDRIRHLLTILDDLQRPKDGMCRNTCRFLRSPTVGSLHQLRAELQVRYEGRQCWVKTPSGHHLDAMLISCKAGDGACRPGLDDDDDDDDASSSGHQKEDVPLKSVRRRASSHVPRDGTRPTIVWCNPNAGFYETMVYDSQWLEFYLSHNFDVFLFNYRGFGRSSGSPTPSALKEDGDSVVDFLRKRGVTQIGVHARSIGGIVGCHIARNNQKEVKLLVADRTFCTLATTAKFTFGDWAVQGLSLAATYAENTDNFLEARCYKVLITDPKDSTIPDIASLRSAVALDALERMVPAEKLHVDEEALQRVAAAWAFLETLLVAVEGGEAGGPRCVCCPPSDGARSLGSLPMPRVGAAGSLVSAPCAARDLELAGAAGEAAEMQRDVPETITVRWMEDHPEAVRIAVAPFADSVRMALEVACTSFEVGGMPLDELLSQAPHDPVYALRCFLANVQVWGSVGENGIMQFARRAAASDEALFLGKSQQGGDSVEVSMRRAIAAETLSSKQVSAYYRQLARTQVARSRRELRVALGTLRQALEESQGCTAVLARRVLTGVVSQVREIESLITSISQFFRCVDLAGDTAGGSSLEEYRGRSRSPPQQSAQGEGPGACPPPPPPVFRGGGGGASAAIPEDAPTPPVVDHERLGYLVPVECGHNGFLDEAETRHLSLHVRAARVGQGSQQDGSGSTLAPVALGAAL